MKTAACTWKCKKRPAITSTATPLKEARLRNLGKL
ncbi:UNVERIFIED_CONTAM: hypothetical protein GTU68_023639 [Idotea baltica]|nr:hypothetical protein [Idotea baltica]